ncbi:hypothetical protein C823_007383 [Eubacterium plexicaudatum ASF492]|uniref:Acyltransferase 3 domain-containing protein n=1 Tax=Eubacterium plexicaudatum ASF492 TaxID=1235802 RepID=N2AL64_9FIRM|nr:hypothetical protein C823_007383 [Eubacterium plexicaudatum ASF492]
MRKRNRIADILKGLGMIFVVGGHTASPLSGYYYTFHMGLFFAISGYLMAANWREMEPKEYISKKFRKIIVPYVVFLSLYCLLENGKVINIPGVYIRLE